LRGDDLTSRTSNFFALCTGNGLFAHRWLC